MYEIITVPRLEISLDIEDRYFDTPFVNVSIEDGRKSISAYRDFLCQAFAEGYNIQSLLFSYSDFIDDLLSKIYSHFNLDTYTDIALLAVGGFGRRELFLMSDIDILVVSAEEITDETCKDRIENFISFLWDLKLDLGSAVRSVAQTVENSRLDITVKTNLLETHFIAGSEHIYNELLNALEQDNFWDTRKFLKGKLNEQVARHHSYKDTGYNLEPDIKNNPGCLRDIQVMQWIANFHFKAKTIDDMLNLGFLNRSEFDELVVCRNFLWHIRYALHVATQRHGDRLTLDRQIAVASLLGYGDDGNRPVEKLMRSFYRTVRRIRELNSMALQLETVRITGHLGDDDEPEYLNSYFLRRGPLIDIADPDIFMQDPQKMLEVFYEISKHDNILGLHVNCLRQLREARRRLPIYLFEIPECRATLKKILNERNALNTTLPLMHDHRILSAYMPQWERIEGQSQFDMFHMYSVDEHTIRVLKNICDLNESDNSIFALFKNVYNQIADVEILNVAAFLHDIAKGTGGHHAVEGAKEALYFCQLHGYTQYQTQFISFLVLKHLLMSSTAQRRDINDPNIVNSFAREVEDEDHLNCLYCLTVADITATNDREWTSWKDSIFRQLYFATRQVLRQGFENPRDMSLHVKENQQIALRHLPKNRIKEISALWSGFENTYFIHYSAFEIAWHTRNILEFNNKDKPLILFAQHADIGTEVLIISNNKIFNFASIVLAMAYRKLNVQSAQIMRKNDNFTLCTIKFQTQHGGLYESDRLHLLRNSLYDSLHNQPKYDVLFAHVKSPFKVPTVITFLPTKSAKNTCLEISTLDTHGLLAKIGMVFNRCNCQIVTARITTTGERADDFFSITTDEGLPLSQPLQDKLQKELYKVLELNNT
ncbi:PII uridylyl-transferase [Anaerobiospirillum thomasii]|uniref:[protein-PII] uridylyltransferase n=1 Tax=Anaerobiospirillum thomasii TaxID=179995 RepID=UPI000D8A944B|nr:[protein-PII] uridylyltransferase [Anaerobiospirillum thomasii]SPT71859.1 PII uridylyl-transferase [Anaerobiospirillum thomasii]